MNILANKFDTLFLDRDGVINFRPTNDYVKTWEQFIFLPGVLDALRILSAHFTHIIVVTNQQGIGKNIMSHEDLKMIHDNMISEIKKHNGRIDSIYYCPDLANKSVSCRKPGIKMAEMAKQDYPKIEFQRCIMVGDTIPDMEFGNNAGMTTVYVGNILEPASKLLVNYQFNNLLTFAHSLVAND